MRACGLCCQHAPRCIIQYASDRIIVLCVYGDYLAAAPTKTRAANRNKTLHRIICYQNCFTIDPAHNRNVVTVREFAEYQCDDIKLVHWHGWDDQQCFRKCSMP